MTITEFYNIIENIAEEFDFQITSKMTVTFGTSLPYQRAILQHKISRRYIGTIRTPNHDIFQNDEEIIKNMVYKECFEFIFGE